MKQLGKNEEKTEYINLNLSNDEYYIGQSKNGLRNGRGIQYNKNGDIIYEGEFINDKIFCGYNVCKVNINESSENYGFGFLCKIPSLDKSKILLSLIIINYSIIVKNCLE